MTADQITALANKHYTAWLAYDPLNPLGIDLRERMGLMIEEAIAEQAAELERLRAGGCARDQGLTQYCAEAVELQAKLTAMTEARDHAVHAAHMVAEELSTLRMVMEAGK